MTQLRRSFPVLSLVLLGGCVSRQSVGLSANIQTSNVAVQLGTQGKTDLLFMIDNSPSMDAMQAELRAHIGDLMAQLAGLNKGKTLDLHVGVVTSDYGAGDVPAGPCQASPGGQRGHLQAIGAAADAGCKAPVGAPYVAYHVDDQGVVTSNLPPGQDLLTTFTCMASVGAAGCGFEHQLESVYAALKNPDQASQFLRPTALLAVVFLTNEDDGSADPSAVFYEPNNDPLTYGAYDTFRQTRFAVECGGMPIPYGNGMVGNLTGCDGTSMPATADVLHWALPSSKYIDFFTKPLAAGGIKADPSSVLLFAIDGPDTPVQTILANNNSGLGLQDGGASPTYTDCSSIGGSCVERLQHSCQNHVNPAFFADPPLRINAVVNSVQTHSVASICGSDLDAQPDFTTVLQSLGKLISAQISPGCIPAPLTSTTAPDCVVEDVTTSIDGKQTEVAIPSCMQLPGADACWKVEQKDLCTGISPDGVGITIVRTKPADPNTFATVECSTVATPAQ